jgi:isoleucyl-tRNA synthetase
LYEVLLRLSKIAAPFVPFISEAIYRNLRTENMPESVHLCDFPRGDEHARDKELEQQMQTVMSVVGLGRQVRVEHNLKVRQPLAALHVVCRDADALGQVEALKAVIEDELNVKEVVFSRNETELVELKAKPNFKSLGPRLGPKVKAAAGVIAGLDTDTLERMLEGGEADIEVGGEQVTLRADDVVVERIPHEHLAVASEGDIVVALETDLTDELLQEGLAREFVNKVQNMRKEADLEVTDRIRVTYSGDDAVSDAVRAHGEYIAAETLATETIEASGADNHGVEWDLNGHACILRVDAV